MSVSSTSEFLPNLPGFKAREMSSGFKKSYFAKTDGVIFVKDESPMMGGGLDEGSVGTFNTSMLSRSGKKTLGNPDIILTFHAYFEEAANAPGNNTDRIRIRKCNIYYFLEDGTISIVEKPQVNSGIPQGKLVRRSVICRSDGLPFTLDDFQLGEPVNIYSRIYNIVDCDESTRRYLQNVCNREEVHGVEMPRDPYEDTRRKLQHPGTMSNQWDRFHSKKNPNKKFMEAQLGNTVNNAGRQGFIQYGNQTLKFHCVWDNTENLYGDRLDYSLVYNLSDDTIEINSMGAGKSDQFSRLLKRSRLPKSMQPMILGASDSKNADDVNPDNFYHFSDFFIGQELLVYARTLRIIDADAFTRQFYADRGMELGVIELEPVEEITVHARELPAYTGFGSEEDSLRSCTGSLLPGPVPAKKLGENKVLSFFASLLSGGPDDVDRKFVVQLFVIDNTIKVQEPPIRNSGFVGGVFLSRRQVKNADGVNMTEKDLYVGCKLRILKHLFLLHSANSSTMNWMESKKLPRASFYTIVDKIRPYLIEQALSGDLAKTFEDIQNDEDRMNNTTTRVGNASKDTLKAVLETVGLIGDRDDQICEHELLTILRANGNTSSTFSYDKLIEQLVAPTDEFA